MVSPERIITMVLMVNIGGIWTKLQANNKKIKKIVEKVKAASHKRCDLFLSE